MDSFYKWLQLIIILGWLSTLYAVGKQPSKPWLIVEKGMSRWWWGYGQILILFRNLLNMLPMRFMETHRFLSNKLYIQIILPISDKTWMHVSTYFLWWRVIQLHRARQQTADNNFTKAGFKVNYQNKLPFWECTSIDIQIRGLKRITASEPLQKPLFWTVVRFFDDFGCQNFIAVSALAGFTSQCCFKILFWLLSDVCKVWPRVIWRGPAYLSPLLSVAVICALLPWVPCHPIYYSCYGWWACICCYMSTCLDLASTWSMDS